MNSNDTKIFNSPILITGGAGFLGSHMAAYFLEKKIDFVIIDNLSNNDLQNLQKLEQHFNEKIPFFQIDLTNFEQLNHFFINNYFSAVIHFAGLKSVSESVSNPDLYFKNNVVGSQNLIDCIKNNKIKRVIFSSSATVYGNPKYLPIDEKHMVKPMNPYGESKANVERLFMSDKYFKTSSVKVLRYFNPVGSYKGIIGERPRGVPNNLMPYILGVANGKFPHLNIYGDDYDTTDGTGVRDYIHVMDLIEAHWLALLDNQEGCEVYNVGCGLGFSVKQIIDTFEKVNQIKIKYEVKPRRDGDIASCFAKTEKINTNFSWTPQFNIEDMCFDAWHCLNNG